MNEDSIDIKGDEKDQGDSIEYDSFDLDGFLGLAFTYVRDEAYKPFLWEIANNADIREEAHSRIISKAMFSAVQHEDVELLKAFVKLTRNNHKILHDFLDEVETLFEPLRVENYDKEYEKYILSLIIFRDLSFTKNIEDYIEDLYELMLNIENENLDELDKIFGIERVDNKIVCIKAEDKITHYIVEQAIEYCSSSGKIKAGPLLQEISNHAKKQHQFMIEAVDEHVLVVDVRNIIDSYIGPVIMQQTESIDDEKMPSSSMEIDNPSSSIDSASILGKRKGM